MMIGENDDMNEHANVQSHDSTNANNSGERLLTQEEVNRAVIHAKNRGFEKGRSSVQQSQISPEEIEAHVQAALEKRQKQYLEEQQRLAEQERYRQHQEIVNNMENKLAKERESDPEFAEEMKD